MKKNNIKILVLVIVVMVTMVACKPADKNLRNLTTQTRLRDGNINNNLMGNDSPLNARDGVNDLGMGNKNLNDRFMGNDKTNNNKLNNGMFREGMMNPDTNLSTNISNMSSRSTAIAERVMALPEINNASVLINGDTAIVGCDVKGDTSNKISNALKQKVEAAVKVADRNIQKVSITSDSSMYTRIQTMSKDMNSNNTTMDGNPATKFTREIELLLKDITNMK